MNTNPVNMDKNSNTSHNNFILDWNGNIGIQHLILICSIFSSKDSSFSSSLSY